MRKNGKFGKKTKKAPIEWSYTAIRNDSSGKVVAGKITAHNPRQAMHLIMVEKQSFPVILKLKQRKDWVKARSLALSDGIVSQLQREQELKELGLKKLPTKKVVIELNDEDLAGNPGEKTVHWHFLALAGYPKIEITTGIVKITSPKDALDLLLERNYFPVVLEIAKKSEWRKAQSLFIRSGVFSTASRKRYIERVEQEGTLVHLDAYRNRGNE